MNTNTQYKAVIFDLFGTLVGTFSSNAHDLVLNKMAKILGIEYEAFTTLFDRDMRVAREMGKYSTIEENIKSACKVLGVNPRTHDVINAAQYRLEFMEQSLLPRSDAIQTIKQIMSKGCMIGLISDCSPEVPILWSKTPFAELIEVTVFSCEVGIKKPDQRIYQLACDKLKIEPGECLYVGDGDSSELEGALAVGMDPILIRVQGENNHDRDRSPAYSWSGKKVSSLSDILQYV
jgi:putative hydrolase of the HAD superfamily